MADFKLGRIKFVWKGAWTTSTTYYVDDVIRYGGKTFICVIGHTSSPGFDTDLNNVPNKWNQFTDGQDWKGDWTPTTFYKINDIVRYGAQVYICNTSHTSQSLLESDSGKWTLFSVGLDWKGDWQTSTTYKENDIVKYGGYVYICVNPHTSAVSTALGLEQNQIDWELFNEGFDWKGDWAAGTRYKVNDVVKYGGQVYVCNLHHTSNSLTANGLEADQAKWTHLNRGLEYTGDWSAGIRYKVNDLVKYGASIWRCNLQHTSIASFDNVKFELFVEGIEFAAVWSLGVTYQPGDLVRYGGNAYVAKTINIDTLPPTGSSDWDLFTQGFKFEGDYSAVTSYKIGDVVRHGGYTYVAVQDTTGQTPPGANWNRLNSGLQWRGEWTNSTAYILGDVVRFNQLSYICVQAHTSADDDSTTAGDANRSPETDTSGTFWNVMIAGLEDSVLENRGDLVYFGPSGVAKLPVGEEGQVLAVVDGLPTWKTWGESENLFYVGLHGEDAALPANGLTLDRPWRTVRYATEQIKKGYKNPNAAYLLEQNRTFIQSEIIGWTNAQISGNIAPFTTGFVYNQAKCQRDMGLLVDALIYDITHGGNTRSIAAARAYYSPLGVSYITGQEDETVASINYGLTVIESVLSNIAPVASYQGGSPNLQIIDISYTSEQNIFAEIEDLAGIVTDAILAGDLDDLPRELVPGYTIMVKTGLFEEVLPIIVPADTSIVGDELRSSKVSPAGSLIAANDKAKSVATLQRLKAITGDIVTNVAVTPTSGNTTPQNRTSQKAGSTGSSLAVTRTEANIAEIKDILNNGLGAVNPFVLTNPTGWGSSLTATAYASTGNPTGDTTGYDNARAQILANTAFLKAEITAWIAVQVAGSIAPFSSGFTYDAAACARDVGYILDAIRYDLTYGGNTQTMVAAKAYYTFGAATFGEGEKDETLAAYARLKIIVEQVILETLVSVSAGNPLTQDTSGTAGSAASGNFAEERVQNIIDLITVDGVTTAVGYPATINPDTSWVPSALLKARTYLNALRSTVQSDSVAYIKREYPTLLFDEVTCSRDVGLIVDALGFDLMFNSNFASIKAGMAYRRGTESALLVVAEQLAATDDIIDFIGEKSKFIVASGAVIVADEIWEDIIDYVNTGTRPIIIGTNEPVEDLDIINGAKILKLNREFITAEAAAYIDQTFRATVTAATGGATDQFTCGSQTWMVAGDTVRFSGTVFGGINTTTTYYILSSGLSATTFKVSLTPGGTAVDLTTAAGSMTVKWYYNSSSCMNDVRSYVDAISKDIVYTGNYNSVLAARYYRSALTGSKLEDMYLVRNGCGIRNQTLLGLDGSSDGDQTGVQSALTPANEFGTSRPRAGAYVSLDPGWGPNDIRAWVINKSTYVQNVTTFGKGATGQKIDGALHAGGNDSIVSNDFTQVIDDGIGAWVTNLGRAELVSVFSYYAHIGYLAENGGKIRATNGNNSYGDFGSVSEGVDLTETPLTGKINNRGNEANISDVINTNNEILIFEYANAGLEYNTATYTISGSGSNAAVVGNEIRDGGVYQVRLTDPGDSSGPGGTGYKTSANVAQGGNATSITLAATDAEISTAYVGMGVWIVAGTGAGQYGYIFSYNAGNKVAQVYKPSTGTPGWDHVVPGTTIASSLDLTTSYEIVPRLEFTAPPYSKALRSGLSPIDWQDIVYGDGFGSYTSLGHTGGTGSGATFDIVRRNGSYTVEIDDLGFNYDEGDTLTIVGANLGGSTPANNLTINVTEVDPDSGGILAFTSSGTAISQQWVAVAANTNQINTSTDGITWTARTLPNSRKWSSIAYGAVGGIGTYVACAREANNIVYSIDGINWTSVTLGAGEEWDWNSIAYGDGRFVMVAESDSSLARRAVSTNGGVSWSLGNISTGAIAITYGQGRFVIVEGSFSNSSAYSSDGVTWVTRTLPANDDSSESNWKDVAHGNNRFVAIADNDAQVAVSIDRGVNWIKAQLPTNAPWKKLTYGNGLFFAFAEGDVAATSEDGILWNIRNFQAGDIDILNTSKDRIVPWQTSTSLTADTWGAMTYGTRYVAIAFDGGSTAPAAAYSNNGTTWVNSTFPAGTTGDVRDIAYGDGWYIVPQAQSQRIYHSQDGITFTFGGVNVLGATQDWAVVAFGNGRFVVVTFQNNLVRWVTSASLNSNVNTVWTVGGTLTATAEWTDMVYGGDKFVVISGVTIDSNTVNYSTNGGVSWTATTMPSSSRWSSITYGNGRFVAVAGNTGTTTTSAAWSADGITWNAATLPGAAARWTNVSWNGSVFVATAYNSNRSAVSENGSTWSSVTMANTANWSASASDTATFKTAVANNGTGTTNLLEYEANTNLITIFDTSQLAVGDYLVIPNDSAGVELFGGLPTDTRLYIKTIYDATRLTVSLTPGGSTQVLSTGSGSMFAIVNKIWSAIAYGRANGNNGFIALAVSNPAALNVYAGAKARGRPAVLENELFEIWIHEPGSNYSVSAPPTMTITDPNNIGPDASHQVRVGNGVLSQPSFTNRGTGYTTAAAELVGDGFADNYQVGAFVDFKDLSGIPKPGSNLQIEGIGDIYYKIVQVRNLTGAGTFSANIQLSPPLGAAESPDHETACTIRSRFSQVRLTGHDFLDIGTGDKTETNYPGLPSQAPNPARETVQSNGGRVFWTSTDQDGNFRVGGLFNVEQATGTATLNAEAFNLAGLNELSLGSVELGGGGAAITEFSTDPFFTADSDSVVPTQRAIKAYISSQIGGGSGSLNVNTITAGSIFISGNSITTTNLAQININTVVNFIGGVDGYPVALNLFLQA